MKMHKLGFDCLKDQDTSTTNSFSSNLLRSSAGFVFFFYTFRTTFGIYIRMRTEKGRSKVVISRTHEFLGN